MRIGRQTPSGIAVPLVVTRDMCRNPDPGQPGQYPFTRGIFADGYRGRPWTMRQCSGLARQRSLTRDTDSCFQWPDRIVGCARLATQAGLDPSDPMARPEIGKVGVSISNLSEMEILFRDLDLGSISTSFTINGTAAIIYAMYLACADKVGVPRSRLTGTIQNDILKEYVARGTSIFPVRPSMRLIADSILFSTKSTPRLSRSPSPARTPGMQVARRPKRLPTHWQMALRTSMS